MLGEEVEGGGEVDGVRGRGVEVEGRGGCGRWRVWRRLRWWGWGFWMERWWGGPGPCRCGCSIWGGG